ncbi:MAG: sulfatase-like hydrolase/transferase [Proteobacteria bacterium]|nr:sulfatase-like hydrolase/transferase [Pseudomonadota bacterium]
MSVTRIARCFATDLVGWYCLPCAFLVAYVVYLQQPAASVIPHIAAMALPFTALIFIRLLTARLISQPTARLATASVLLGVCIGSTLVYYALVLISLNYWGGVVAWNAIPTFIEQVPDMADAMHVPRLALGVGVGALSGCLFTTSWCYLKHFDWTADLGRTAWTVALCITACAAMLWMEAASAFQAPWIAQAEPLSMTLFPLAGSRDIEGHRINAADAQRLDETEDRARASYMPASRSAKRNLVLIVVDALRPDHMSLFGYARKTTPYMEAIESSHPVRKLIAHASCGDTVCGLLSLASSKSPRDLSFRPFGLHEVLRRNGYRIHMILSGDHTYFHPMKEYYGHVDTWFDGNSAVSTSIDDDQPLIDHLAAMADWDGAPTMFQFHLMSAHVTRRDDGKRVFSPARSYLLAPRVDYDGPDTQLATATNYYDNGVFAADHVVETLISQLLHKGYLRNALVVITADHGESLGEHGIFGHANSVREELLKVPVIFVAYGHQIGTFSAHVVASQIDIAPTILAELDIPQPETWEGHPLQAPFQPSVTYFEERSYIGLLDPRMPGRLWKYWVDRDRGNEFAFDLSVDPHEKHNLIATVPEAIRGRWRRAVLYEKAEAPIEPVVRNH